MRRRLAQDPESTEINVSPLIDLVFILLIFFIVATSFVNEVGITPKPVSYTHLTLPTIYSV